MTDLILENEGVSKEGTMTPVKLSVDIHRILEMIKHRYPFLLIDKVIDIVPSESATGIKNVTINEPFFNGHFPGRPVMPGVLIVEAMAQTAAILVVQTLGKAFEDKLVYFMSIEEAKFRKPVIPGDVMQIRIKKDKNRANIWRFACEAYVEETKVAEAIVTAMIMDK